MLDHLGAEDEVELPRPIELLGVRDPELDRAFVRLDAKGRIGLRDLPGVDVDPLDAAESEVGENLRVGAGVATDVERRAELRHHPRRDQLAHQPEEEIEPQAVEDAGLEVVAIAVEIVELPLERVAIVAAEVYAVEHLAELRVGTLRPDPAASGAKAQKRPRRRSLAGRFSRQVVHQPERRVSMNSGGSEARAISRATVSTSYPTGRNLTRTPPLNSSAAYHTSARPSFDGRPIAPTFTTWRPVGSARCQGMPLCEHAITSAQ